MIVLGYSTRMYSHIIQNSLMPPLLSYLLLHKGPEVLAHDGHWSRHQSMTFPTQILFLWRRRGPGGCYHDVIPDNHEKNIILTFVRLRIRPPALSVRIA